MLCVLKGTSLQGCNVPTFQGVKKTAMNKNKCEVDVGDCEHGKDFGTETYYMEGRCGGENSGNPKYSFRIATDPGSWDGPSAFNKCEGQGYVRLCDYMGGHHQHGCVMPQGCSGYWHNGNLPSSIWGNDKSTLWKKNYLGKTCGVRSDGGNGAACFHAHGQSGSWSNHVDEQQNLRVVCIKKM